MKIKILPPETDDYPKTFLTAKALGAATALNTKNTAGFIVGKLLVIGRPGEEGAEIKTLASIAGNVLNLSAALALSHAENSEVQVINYDYVKILKASSIDGTYVEVDSLQIAIDEQVTIYEDAAALDTDYFKIQYFNSANSDVSAESDPINATGFGRASLASLVERVFTAFGDVDRKFLDTGNITEWINEAKDVLVNMIAESNEKYFLAKEILDLDGTGETDAPDTFKKSQKLKVGYDGTEANSRRARKVEIEDIDDETMTYDQSSPVWYFNNFKIGVRPKGTAIGKIYLWHEAHPADLEDDSDTLPKPIDRYINLIIDYAVAKAYERDKKFSVSDRFMARFAVGAETMIEHINNIVLDENRRIRDDDEIE